MNVIILGEQPFTTAVVDSCLAAGYSCATWEVDDVLGNPVARVDVDQAARADVVVEMYNASAAAKRTLLERAAELTPGEATWLSLALATSATQAAAWLSTPQRLVGFGLILPLGDRPVIEIAAALQTAQSHLAAAETFWQGAAFETVRVGDGPGLVRARILCCLINEAASALMEGVASAKDIDLAMKLGTNYPYGPLEWADQLGLDIVLAVMTGLFEEWGDDRYRPTPLLRRMVLAGQLGAKAGRGFYVYDSNEPE
ncbi:MAG: 3-hydroxybutyryl-CoA dehydrogenase [Chloroflexota bacterium]|nr:MAG: 3-hydroxybutyryl-CoA dehydrogenase [Chloroflexota bacterium]